MNNERSLSAIERLEKLDAVLKLYGVEKYVSYDLGMLSKYNYYTGVIFKAYTYGVGNAIITGGRYNTLLSRFGKDAPAVGFAIVIDDLMEALSRQQGPLPDIHEVKAMYYDADKDGDFARALKEAQMLRSNGQKVALLAKVDGEGKE